MKPVTTVLSLLFLLNFSFNAQIATAITIETPEDYQEFLSYYRPNGYLHMDSVGDLSLSGGIKTGGTPLLYLTGPADIETLGAFKNMGDIVIQGNETYGGIESFPTGGYSENQIVFQNTGNILFSDLSNSSGGAIFATSGGLVFSHVQSITLENNSAYQMGGRGGALYLNGNQKDIPGRLIIDNLEGDFTARKNSSGEYGGGGAISNTSGGLTFVRTGNIVFDQNTAGWEGGGAILSGGQANYLSFAKTKNIHFTNNTAQGYGGAIRIEVALAVGSNGLLFQETGDILFQKNKSIRETESYGGAIFAMNYDKNQKVDIVFQQTGKVEFIENSATFGGAIYAGAFGEGIPVSINVTGANSVLFEKNHAEKSGSAIYCTNLVIADCGDVSFLGNITDEADGSAIVLNMQGTGKNILSADRGNILFRGNSDTEQYGLIAWGNGESDLNMRAAEGKKISFYDSVHISSKSQDSSLTWDLNKEENYTGTIVFSGEDFDANAVQLTIKDGNLLFHKGTLIIEKNAVMQVSGDSKSFTQKEGLLDISLGTISAPDIFMITASPEKMITIKAGENVKFLANHSIDWRNGLAFDLEYYLPVENGFVNLDGVKLTTPSLILGNKIAIADKGNKLEYYENVRWKSAHTFVLADITNVESVSGDFSGIFSQLSDSDIVNGFGYNGVWSYENRDGQLLAIWTPTLTPDPSPEPKPEPEKSVHPELAGNLTLNSLWSTVSNMRALSRAALGEVGVTRLLLPRNTNYWALGLGDFSSHKNRGGIDGYDYNGFGYALGADTHLADSLIGGLAFGNLYGKNKSRSFNAHIDQASYMGLAYSSWSSQIDKTNSLVLDGAASYGITSNKLDTRYSDGDSSKGKWDNNAMRFTLRGEWNHSLDRSWTLSPFLAVEYDQAWQKSFTETGDKARRFDRSTLRNLALPVGLGLSHRMELSNGKQWLNSLEVSYVPDVYRKNPESATLRTTNGFTWTAEGLRPVRNAGRLEYNTRYQFNESWAVFGGYSLEGRKDSIYHNANIGISASF